MSPLPDEVADTSKPLDRLAAVGPGPWVKPRMLPSKTHSGPVVISFWGKGGATKTTASLMLAGVASYLGLGVLVIDTDPQGSAALWRSRRGKDDIAVQTGRPDQLEGFLARAQHGDFDLVLIDNAPAKNAYVSRVAALSDLSIISKAFTVRSRNWTELGEDVRRQRGRRRHLGCTGSSSGDSQPTCEGGTRRDASARQPRLESSTHKSPRRDRVLSTWADGD